MDVVTITEATADERAWSARLMAASEPWLTLGRGIEQCLAGCMDPEYLIWIASAGGRPRGFARVHPRGVAGSPYLASVAVTEDARSLGIGSQLIDFVERMFTGKSRYIFLCVSSFNPRARSLYERRGYALVGELKDYVVDGLSELLMAKKLQ